MENRGAGFETRRKTHSDWYRRYLAAFKIARTLKISEFILKTGKNVVKNKSVVNQPVRKSAESQSRMMYRRGRTASKSKSPPKIQAERFRKILVYLARYA